MTPRRLLLLVVVLGTVTVTAGAARAGGPIVTTTNGLPVGWDTTAPVQYRTDLGPLGTLTNAAAVAKVGSLFDTWTAVPSAVIAFERAGATTVDIDATNFGPFLGPFGGATAPLGQNVIAFDADGAIFDALYGVGSGVLGFASLTFLSDGVTTVPIGAAVPPGAKIVEGLAFLNGKWIDGIDDPPSGNYELPLDVFDAVFVHEFGHFVGLDHTQAHGMFGPVGSDLIGRTTPVETMFPFLVDATQGSLERDDVVALSRLYPSVSFATTTGRITGRVLAPNGMPISGANVLARNVADDTDLVTYVAGATIVPAGAYTLAGLTPGASYRVEVEEVDSAHTGGSRVGPFSPPIIMPGPPEAWNGAAESADPAVDDPSAATTIVAAAGVTTSGIDVTLNYQRFAVDNVALPDGGDLQSFALADFDGDAAIDFVAPQTGFVPGNLTRFYRAVGDGTFDAPALIDAFPGNAYAAAGQFNPGVDAFPDVAVLSVTLLEVRVYFGDGLGGFAAPVTIVGPPNPGFVKQPTELVAGNLNGDAFTDLATVILDVPTDSATVYAFLGSAGGTFTVVATPLGPGSPYPRTATLRLAQLAGSPALDLIGVRQSTDLSLLTGDGAGGFTASAIALASVTVRLGTGLDVGDFDEDGLTDVVVSDLNPLGGPPNFTRSFIDVLRGDGAGGFTLSDRYEVPEVFQFGIEAAYVDDDAHLDVASVGFGPSPGAKMSVAFGDGNGGMSAVSTTWGLPELPLSLKSADLNGDGRTDFLINNTSPVYSVLLPDSCGDGVLQAPEQCDDGDRVHGDGCDGNCTVTGCGNGVVSAGEQCDDGNTIAGDGCSSTCGAEAVCGDGIVSGLETCDDGNLVDGDCCSSSCTLDPPATACGQTPSLCYVGWCDGEGICHATPRPPRPTCRQSTTPRAGKLQLQNHGIDAKDRLDWKWGKGVVTPKSAFGDPTTTTDYALCVYDTTDRLIASAVVPAGTRWRSTANGFRYSDPATASGGVRRIVLTRGLEDGKARVVVGAKGVNVDLPAQPIAPVIMPLRAQLEARNGECWVTTYGTYVTKNTADTFSAKND